MLRRVCVLASLFLCLGSTIALAEPRLSDQATSFQLAQRRQAREGGLLRELNLSRDQIQRMKAIRNQYKGQIEQRRQTLRQAQQELRSLMAGSASRGQIMDKFRQVESLRQQLAELQFNSMLDVREILTPEQRRKLAETLQNRREDFFDRRNGN